MPDIGKMPANSLNPTILQRKTTLWRQISQLAQFIISLRLRAMQNHYKIAIEKLKYEQTNPFLGGKLVGMKSILFVRRPPL